jgi:DNA-binding response OmpR family regulator
MRSRTIRAVAIVKDLFFVARFRETARLSGAVLTFARSPVELSAALAEPTDLVIVDLTVEGWDYAGFFAELENLTSSPPVLGVTTHAVARRTQPLHSRCTRVVTRETLTQELGTILREGLAA